MARAGEHIDAVEGITRMGHVGLVLLIPPVEGAEAENDVPGQVWVCEPEPGTRAVLAGGSYIYRLTIGGVGGEQVSSWMLLRAALRCLLVFAVRCGRG
jgi:hypothetical protein